MTITIREFTEQRYETTDGSIFDNEVAAHRHQRLLNLQKLYQKRSVCATSISIPLLVKWIDENKIEIQIFLDAIDSYDGAREHIC